MSVIGKTQQTSEQLAATNGKLEIANCKDCPFSSAGHPTLCELSVAPMPGGGVCWRYVHGNSAPPSWCPIRKYNGIELTVEVEPSPDHWHHG